MIAAAFRVVTVAAMGLMAAPAAAQSVVQAPGRSPVPRSSTAPVPSPPGASTVPAPSITPAPSSLPAPSITPAQGLTAEPVQPLPVGQTVWINQDGSTLALTIEPTGQVTGSFAPAFPCGATPTGLAAPAVAAPVIGTAAGNAVTWTVALPACASVGTWIGHLQGDVTGDQLRTIWVLAVTDTPPGVGSTLMGVDVFARQLP